LIFLRVFLGDPTARWHGFRTLNKRYDNAVWCDRGFNRCIRFYASLRNNKVMPTFSFREKKSSFRREQNFCKCDLDLMNSASLCLCCHKQYNFKVWWQQTDGPRDEQTKQSLYFAFSFKDWQKYFRLITRKFKIYCA